MRILLLSLLIILSCTSNTETTKKVAGSHDSASTPIEENTGNMPAKPITAGTGTCYWQIMQRDTFVAVFSKTGASVSGKLTFDNFQKDGSSGSISGLTDNDIMKLWYSFESEGMNSTMEVWFKIDGDNLLRGTGEMSVRSDSSYFSNPGAVNFKSDQELKKVDCSEIPSKYK